MRKFSSRYYRAVITSVLVLILPLLAVQIAHNLVSGFSIIPPILPAALLVNLLIVSACYFSLIAITNSLYGPAVVTVFLQIFIGFVNAQKVRILLLPLLPSDFLYIDLVWEIADEYWRLFIGLIAVVLVTVIIAYRFRKFFLPLALNPLRRLLFLMLSLTVLGGFVIFPKETVHAVKDLFQFHVRNQDILDNYRRFGIYYCMFYYLQNMKVESPDHYSRNAINILFKSDLSESYPLKEESPDIIMYLSESFFDITSIKAIPFQKDPIPSFRKLSRNGNSFNITTPVFAGSTSVAEFEFLTGFSTIGLPQGAKPYQEYVKFPIPSLPAILKAQGYRTTAIHSFYKYYWNRERVYPLIGIDTFMGLEDMHNPPVRGKYTDDSYLNRLLFNYLEERKDDKNFVFLISMQNHGPYDYTPSNDLSAYLPYGTIENHRALACYTSNLIDADRNLSDITEWILRRKKPTVLVYFGDHLPGLTSVYDSYQFFSEDKAKKMYTVPGVVVANFPVSRNLIPATTIPASGVPGMVLRIAGRRSSRYFLQVDHLLQRDDKNALSNFKKIITYDILFGDGFSRNMMDLME